MPGETEILRLMESQGLKDATAQKFILMLSKAEGAAELKDVAQEAADHSRDFDQKLHLDPARLDERITL